MNKINDILTRLVLIEKVPFPVLRLGMFEDYHGICLVRRCVSIKELIKGLTKGYFTEEKKIFIDQIESGKRILNVLDFYIIVKSDFQKDIGRAIRISYYEKFKK